MSLISIRPYRDGSAIIIGFGLGLVISAMLASLAFGLCLGVGTGAVIDGLIRIKAARQSRVLRHY